jgi:four helix bundle protein
MNEKPSGKIRSYRDLRVWQKAVELVVICYQLAKKLPPDERFGLVSQIQRAATSIPANIAEGYARRTRGDYIHHLAIAAGSLAELETHWIVVVRLGQLRQEELQPFFAGAGELGKMLEVLIQKLKAKKP